jgi:hypothetical protein
MAFDGAVGIAAAVPEVLRSVTIVPNARLTEISTGFVTLFIILLVLIGLGPDRFAGPDMIQAKIVDVGNHIRPDDSKSKLSVVRYGIAGRVSVEESMRKRTVDIALAMTGIFSDTDAVFPPDLLNRVHAMTTEE